MVQVLCGFCGKEFYSKPSWIKYGGGKYCSPACSHAKQKHGKNFFCAICTKEVYRSVNDQAKSKSGKFFFSKNCQTVWRNQTYVGENHANWKTGISVYRSILKRDGQNQICGKCKTNDTRILAVHHKDKNRNNNLATNLTWLCHNCHYLVHHHAEESIGFLADSMGEI